MSVVDNMGVEWQQNMRFLMNCDGDLLRGLARESDTVLYVCTHVNGADTPVQ